MDVSELKTEVGDLSKAVKVDLKAAKQQIGELKLQNGDLVNRIESLEARQGQPTMATGSQLNSKEAEEHKAAFCDWIRRPSDGGAQRKLEDVAGMLSTKDVTIGTAASGGYAVPEIIGRDIDKFVSLANPLRSLAKVVQVGSSDYKELLDIRGESVGWVAETGTRSATTTPQLREIVPTHGELYAYPQASEWSLDDVFFNVQEWLVENVGMSFAASEAQAYIDGNGTSKPTGIYNTAPVSTADGASPLRAAAAIQFVPSAASPDAITPDSLLDLRYTVKSEYLDGPGVAWIMNRTTAAAVRKLKDTTNDYLWQQGLALGQPATLLGFPVVISDAMPDIATNAHPVLFGNFRRGYLIVDRVGLRITVDQVTTPGYVKFYIRRRTGGIVLNNDAIKCLKTT
jgi:HK97 family phage major capsid protein